MVLSMKPFFPRWLSLLFLVLVFPMLTRADENLKSANQVARSTAPTPLAAVLPPEKWQQVEKAVDRALAWMASQQAADGTFPSLPTGQPGVTSLATMAFLSRGHQPG